jgi:pilus assembly protein Flp/PilA
MRAIVAHFARDKSGVARDKSGATSIEYALIAAIVCLGLIASFTGVRDGVNGLFSNASNALGQ